MAHRFFAGFEPGPPWMNWGGRSRRRVRRGLLKWLVLGLLAEGARHGYDIMKTFEQRGWGRGRAGSIYPTLSSLEEAGFVTTREEDGKKVYIITEEGLSHLRDDRPDIAEDDLHTEVEDEAGAREAMDKLAMAVMQAVRTSTPATLQQIAQRLNAVRKEIYTLLADE